MKRVVAVVLFGCLALMCAGCASASILGPVMKIADANKMPEETNVVVRGKVQAASLSGHYILKDSSGEILFSVDPKKLMGVELGQNNIVEVAGELDRDAQGLEIEANAILKKGTAIRYARTSDVAKMNDDNWVAVKGKLKNRIGDNKYILADKSGELTVEIDDKVWGPFQYDPKQTVEIRGELDVEDSGVVTLEAAFLREL